MKLITMNFETIVSTKTERHSITVGDSIDRFILELNREEWTIMFRQLSKRNVSAPKSKTVFFPLANNRELKRIEWSF